MADGRRAEQWVYWSSLMALLANCHRDQKKSKPARPLDFNPYFANPDANRKTVAELIGVMRSLSPMEKMLNGVK